MRPLWLARPFRRKRWVLWLLALIIIPWLWMACFTPPPGRVTLPELAEQDYAVWALIQDHHAGIIIERPNAWRLGHEEARNAPFVEYGWGDRRFYKDSRRAAHVVVGAVLFPTESVTYVRSHWRTPSPEDGWNAIYRGRLDRARLRRLVTSLEESILRAPDGERQTPHPRVPRYRGRFYPGRESYIFWSSCNTWVLRRLAEAGLASSSRGVLVSSQVPGRLLNMELVR